ncbi:mirror-image polydactyly gene 1 protein [Ambystoma mexicanum]|uniref:mirror-image polydactyly gene 1 protein n=1 Tax=Ambystoma mexicanum TaxID=8296 RepID=UPI0037E7C42F
MRVMDVCTPEPPSDVVVLETSQEENGLPAIHSGLQRAPHLKPENQELPLMDAARVPPAPVPNPRTLYALSSRMEDPAGSSEALSVTERPRARLLSDSLSSSPQAKAVNVDLLLRELDILREANIKLLEALSERDLELQTLKLEQELQGAASEAGLAERTAALVEEVYLAQRERDQAVMARLRLANEERDDAILRAKRLEQSMRELENVHPDSEDGDVPLQELLGRVHVAASREDIDRNAALLMDRLLKTQERRRQITVEEMSAVMAERDAAEMQCKHLEKELHRVREKSQTSTDGRGVMDHRLGRAEKAQLMALQHDRDKAVEEFKKLEEELQTLRVYYSLHQSLSQEEDLKEQFQSAIQTYEEALKNREQVALITQQQNEALLVQAQQAASESAALEARLRGADDKVQRLERLVDVLRKKVGAGSLRTII